MLNERKKLGREQDPEYQAGKKLSTDVETKQRDTWKNNVESFLASLGSLIGCGNIWRFPYITYAYGGGAFLIPYITFAVLCGFPMLFLETSMGQYTRCGARQAWKLAPIMKGVGLGAGVVSFLCNIYFIVVMAWALLYLVNTFTLGDLPWMTCENWFNTNSCVTYIDAMNRTSSEMAANGNVLPIVEFWERYALRRLQGNTSYNLENVGGLDNWPMLLSLAACWVMIYFCIYRGVKSTGKAVYFSATFPYLMLAILLVRGCMLPGAANGISYFLKPNISRLAEANVWVQAGSQVCYSYAICFSVLVAYGSYNKFHLDCYRRTAILATSCSLTSFLAGFAVFSVLGNMALVMGRNVSDVVDSGPGLAFITYPTALSLMPVPQLWNACFFLTLITVALDSEFSCLEGLLTIFYDDWKWSRDNKKLFVGIMCFILFLIGLSCITNGGVYVFEIFNNYAVSGIAILWLTMWQSIGVGWVHGTRDYYARVKEMIGYSPNPFVGYCFRYFTPVLSAGVLTFYVVKYEPLMIGNYTYPAWANGVGWLLCLMSFVCVPAVAVYEVWRRPGTFKQRLVDAMSPEDPLKSPPCSHLALSRVTAAADQKKPPKYELASADEPPHKPKLTDSFL